MAYGFNNDKSRFKGIGVQKVYTSGISLTNRVDVYGDNLTNYFELSNASLCLMQPYMGVLTLDINRVSGGDKLVANEKYVGGIVLPDNLNFYRGIANKGPFFPMQHMSENYYNANYANIEAGVSCRLLNNREINTLMIVPRTSYPSGSGYNLRLSGIVMLQGDNMVEASS